MPPGAASPRPARRPSARPMSPVSIAAMGAGGARQGLRARTLHHLARRRRLERGAPMIEAGLWYRPSYFPRPGETALAPVLRPRGRPWSAARVGVCDVSTLGKIDIQGRDAARLPRFRLHQHLLDAEAGPRALRADAARGRPCHGRRHHRAAGRAPLPDDHHHRRRGPGDAPSGIRAAGAAAASWTCASSRSPSTGRSSPSPARDRASCSNTLLDTPVDGESFPFMACGPVVGRGRGGPAVPDLLLGRARLRDRGAGALWRGALSATSSPGPRRWAAAPTGWRR